MEEHDKLHEILRNPELKKNPFSVPEHYFENLPMQINDRIVQKPKNYFAWINSFYLKTALASMMVILVALFVFKPFSKTSDFDVLQDYQNHLEWSLILSNVSIDQFFTDIELSDEVLNAMIDEELMMGGWDMVYNDVEYWEY
jgi:hypothetical protein